MRDKWYGDNRDLVKWGVLSHLAFKFGARRILHVAYLRQSKWGDLIIDGETITIPSAVLQHFRDVGNISVLGISQRIQVINEPFVHRNEYMKEVVKAIHGRSKDETSIIFLDPDTGLESRRPGMQHVFGSEVAEIWGEILPGDLIVFYQHQTNRKGEPWIDKKREQFEKALGLPVPDVKVANPLCQCE